MTGTTDPAPDIRALQFRELNNALAYLSHAQFHYERAEDADGRMWLDDARRSLGAVALLLAEGSDAEGYARLLEAVLTPPHSPADAKYIERQGTSD